MTGGLRWRGEYELTETYSVGDVVRHPDTQLNYVCVIQVTEGIPPDFYDSGFEPLVQFDITFIDGGRF